MEPFPELLLGRVIRVLSRYGRIKPENYWGVATAAGLPKFTFGTSREPSEALK